MFMILSLIFASDSLLYLPWVRCQYSDTTKIVASDKFECFIVYCLVDCMSESCTLFLKVSVRLFFSATLQWLSKVALVDRYSLALLTSFWIRALHSLSPSQCTEWVRLYNSRVIIGISWMIWWWLCYKFKHHLQMYHD